MTDFINLDHMSARADNFNEIYFPLHQLLLDNGDRVSSRNGATVEFLNFKTIIDNPINRCVGGFNRDINVFFLLAEALWIFAGRKDVSFLDTFNSQLKNYSDDGKSYHAPYGWRLRNYGVSSFTLSSEENKHSSQGMDQIRTAIEMLSNNPEDRRVVLSIWDASLDLNTKSKDLPCNDLVMLKIRNGKLYTTIQNRSNDLNLGLTTNVFQFSFIGEIISKILNIGLGQQIHNSQSLHLYLDHGLTTQLQGQSGLITSIYQHYKANQMDFNFTSAVSWDEKLRLIDFHINSMIRLLSTGMQEDTVYLESLKIFSRYLYGVYQLLNIYTKYKHHHYWNKIDVLTALRSLSDELPEIKNSDYFALANNFFISKLVKKHGYGATVELLKDIVVDPKMIQIIL